MAWDVVELREVIKLDLNRIQISPSSFYEMVGVYSFGKGLFHREPVHGANTSYKFFYQLKPNHLVMSQLFGWEGALAISSEEFSGKYVSPQFPTFLCNENRLNFGFIGWMIRQPSFWADLATRTSGMGDRRRTLNPESLTKCRISLPPLPEQQQIVAKIEALAAKIKEARKTQYELEEKYNWLCRSLIFDKSYGEPVLTPMSELVFLKELDVTVSPEEKYPFAGVYCFGRGVFIGERRNGFEFSYKKLTQLREGDLVYPKLMAWEGAISIVPRECDGLFVSPEFPVFKVNTDLVLPEVLDVYFRTPSVWPLLAGASTGTNVRRRRLNPQTFLKHEFPLPPMKNQTRVRQTYSKVNDIKRLQTQAAAELDALLPAILDRAFKGEL